jgi:hypothetical protein
MKKCLKNLLLLTLFCAIPISSQMLHHLDQDAIDKKVIAIDKMITRQRYAKAFFIALGVAYTLYLCLPPLYNFFQNPVDKAIDVPKEPMQIQNPVDKALDGIDVPQKPIQKRPFREVFVEDCKNFGANTKDLLCTKAGWWRMAKGGLFSCGQVCMYHVMQKMVNEVQYPDTLYRYLQSKVPYKKTTAMIKKMVHRLQYEILTDQQTQHDLSMLQLSCNQLAHYGESICAYMMYKGKELEESNQRDMAQAAARYLFNYHNDWLRSLSRQLEAEKSDYQKISEMIVSYESELAYQLKNFASIEGETKEDRRAVKYGG